MRKSFWASDECLVFPNILYSRDKKFLSWIRLLAKTINYIYKNRPKIIVLGSDLRVKQAFAVFLYLRFFRDIKFISINLNAVPYIFSKNWDKIVYFSNAEVKLRAEKFSQLRAPSGQGIFTYLPVDGNFNLKKEEGLKPYIFSGGGNRRDFGSVIDAIIGMDIDLKISTFKREMINYRSKLPSNCNLVIGFRPLNEYLQDMMNSEIVVVPLFETDSPHGHMTIAQAMSLGKVVISTKNSSVDDYITHGLDGFLVDPGDVEGIKKYIHLLLDDNELKIKIGKNALKKSSQYSYGNYLDFLVNLIDEIID